eukprot:CAMPEP_0170148494 /NCGR_PEP_ID=MMETSP0033_2-20121228/39140_1 /TAXON_ID=195969 /ORGANISM="Dolichomastix tenuilepis, Strain CCMP3274" /LENGTH=185 /DNA_ID=CAMNT_0010385387 /DNA_START=106 /DNA_END=663 /DNA_ORIENTATION=+
MSSTGKAKVLETVNPGNIKVLRQIELYDGACYLMCSGDPCGVAAERRFIAVLENGILMNNSFAVCFGLCGSVDIGSYLLADRIHEPCCGCFEVSFYKDNGCFSQCFAPCCGQVVSRSACCLNAPYISGVKDAEDLAMLVNALRKWESKDHLAYREAFSPMTAPSAQGMHPTMPPSPNNLNPLCKE